MWWSKQLTELQQQAFQQQINWKYPERTVLKSWAMKTRNYDTKGFNWVYGIGNTFFLSISLLFLWLFIKHEPLLGLRIEVFIGIGISFYLYIG